MKQKNELITKAAELGAMLLLAAAPWGILAVYGFSKTAVLLAGGYSAAALAACGIWLFAAYRREKRRKQALLSLCRRMEEALAMPEYAQEEQGSPEQRLERIVSAGVLLRESCENREQALSAFAKKWANKLERPLGEIEKTARELQTQAPVCAKAVEQECVAARFLLEQLREQFACGQGVAGCRRKTVELSQAISDAVVRNAGLFKTKKLGLRRTVVKARVNTDPLMLAAVLDQLLENAAQYSPEGGVIGVSCRENGDTVRLMVEDGGCGVSAGELPHIFERGYRGKNAPAGTAGMGLFMVKSYLELLGHGLEARSVPGKGMQIAIVMQKEQDENTEDEKPQE